MAHRQQKEFTIAVKQKFPEFFKDKRVLDCGSLDINGSNKFLFSGGEYIGVDIVAGKNVNVVCRVHELTYSDESFDVIISTEMLEHDEFWIESLKKMVSMLKSRGLMIITCASTKRKEHLTNRTERSSRYKWGDYYRNLSEEDLRTALDVEKNFSDNTFTVTIDETDLYFWGIKR